MKTIKDINELYIPAKHKNYLLEILSNMKSDENVEDIILFGSCARGDSKDHSDIDLAIITKSKLSEDEELSYFDYLPYGTSENYVECDLLVMDKEKFLKHIDEFGLVQKWIYREGVSLVELLPIRAV